VPEKEKNSGNYCAFQFSTREIKVLT
jgi:hypothetical protein